MRLALALALVFAASAAQASIKEACSGKAGDKQAYANCIDAEHKRAANTLRDLDPQIMKALNAHTQASGSTNRLDAYRKAQATHVRKRSRTCTQQNEISLAVCEGDMDNAQIRALQKYLKEE
jgi:uncharacterized protein YecT (DUF1311 family)